MAVNRYYSSTAVPTELTSGINDSATGIQVNALSGYPGSTPYTIIVDRGTSSQEVMTVTGVAGTNLTVTRGEDGTTALSHSLGAPVEHGVSARDLREAQEHIDATAAHGATGAVVGTTNTQTLTNKTLTAPAISAPVITGGGSWAGSPVLTTPTINSGGTWNGSPTIVTPTIASLANANHDHSNAAGGGFLSRPRCLLKRTATVSLTSGADNTITFSSSEYQNGGTFWTSGSAFFAPVKGDWMMSVTAVFQNAGTNGGMRIAQIRRASDNAPVVEGNSAGPGGSAADWVVVTASFPYRAALNEEFYLYVKQTSGSTMTLASAQVGMSILERTT